ncbi:MAG: saccharopine dehydrogenase C-terminal domain-containing protein [Thermoguttaceae bacterium]|jgi:saccharopine dehydrogenase-like NADP-dependent oxidoreductase
MKILCLGGAGKICRESILDLVQSSSFQQITVADVNSVAGEEVVQWLNDPRVDFVPLDASDTARTTALMRGYDIVMDGTPISMNDQTTACIAAAGVHGINLNGMSREWDLDDRFRQCGKTCVPGFGMTPGITNMLARRAADQLDSIESIRVSHGAFRPIAFSPSIAETTRVEYDPTLASRVVFEDGQLIQMPPFSRPHDVRLPEPYGTHPQYIIPHPETVTLSKSMASKGVRLIEVRGTWPPRNMALLRSLYDWGFLRNDTVDVHGMRVPILDAIVAHWLQSPEGKTTPLYGYALHVEVIGARDGKRVQHVLTHTHPRSDGSVPDWAGLRAYTRCVGIPMSIGAQLIASGKACGVGTVAPELAFNPAVVFAELEKRSIFVHEEVTTLSDRP